MKKVLLIAMALVTLQSMAQDKQENKRSTYTPEQKATLQTKRMTLALDLSATQQEQVQLLYLEQAKLRKSQMEERKARKASEDAKKPTSDERYAMQTARLDQQIAHKAEMKKVLSTEQYERWEKMSKRKTSHKKGKGRKGKGKKRGNNR
ncbi:hypothetical protein N9954_08360 [Maribacter sp.]|nr:hypothetical protein [Maribacter sp.]